MSAEIDPIEMAARVADGEKRMRLRAILNAGLVAVRDLDQPVNAAVADLVRLLVAEIGERKEVNP